MGIVHQEAQPVWVATTNPALPWRVQTSQYTAEMADYLDAGATLGGVLWRFTHRSGRVMAYAPEAIAYVDHLLRFDPLIALSHVQAFVAGDTVTFDHPAYRVTYQALHDRLKLTILLKVPFRAPNGALITEATAFLTLTGGIELPIDLELWDRTGQRIGDFTTHGEVYLKDASGGVVQFLDRVTAHDSEGHAGAGEIRLATDANGTRRLYQGMSWGWLQVASFRPTTAFPEGGVEIDPTVVTSTNVYATGMSNQRRAVRFKNGNLLSAVTISATQIQLQLSTDGGGTWAATGVTLTNDSTSLGGCYMCVDPADPNEYVHILHYPVPGWLRYARVVPDAARTSFTATVAADNLNGDYDDGALMAVQYGAGYKVGVASTDSVNTPLTRLWWFVYTVAADGSITKDSGVGGAFEQWDSNFRLNPALARDTANGVHLLYGGVRAAGTQAASGMFYRTAPFAGGSWAISNPETLDAVGPMLPATTGAMNSITTDSQNRPIAAWKSNGAGNPIVVMRRASANNWASLAAPSIPGATSLGIVSSGDDGYLAFTDGAGLKYVRYIAATGSWGAAVVLDSDTTAKNVTVRADSSGSAIDMLYEVGAASPYTVKSARITLNQPPKEPTLSISPAAFAASVGTQVTIGHNDDDQMGGWALKRVYGSVTEWWNNTTKGWQAAEIFNAGSGISITIPATDNAGKWFDGNVYQLYAATKDSQGLIGLYNSVAVQANVGAVPVVTITSGATTSGMTYDVQWTSDRATSAYQVRVLDGATVVSDTGKVLDGNARIRTVATPTNGKVYNPEVTAWDQTSGGGIASTPATKAVAVSFIAPARPTIAATPVPGGTTACPVPHIGLVVGNPDNLLTADQSSAEAGITGFVPYFAATLSRDTTRFHSGTASLKVVTDSGSTNESSGMFAAPQLARALSPGVTVVSVQGWAFMPAGQLFKFGVRWFGGGFGDGLMTPFLVGTGAWQYVKLENVPVPSGATNAGIQCFVPEPAVGSPVTFWVDDLMSNAGAVAAPFMVGDGPVVVGNTILRRIKDSTVPWTTLPGTVAPNGAYTDTSAASGVTYEYAVTALGDNGTAITGHTDGKTTKTAILTFADKVAGSFVENPHTFRYGTSATFPPPLYSLEINTQDYPKTATADGVVTTIGQYGLGTTYPLAQPSFDVLNGSRRAGSVPAWWDLLTFKSYLKRITGTWDGWGQGPNGAVQTNGAVFKGWISGAWAQWGTTNAGSPAVVSAWTEGGFGPGQYIDDTGFMHFLAHPLYPLNTTNAAGVSEIYTDYVKLSVEVYVQTTAMLTRDCWWFVPVNDPTKAIPFLNDREASIADDRAFTELDTRGRYTVTGIGGRRLTRIDISANFFSPAFSSADSTLTEEQWRQRFEDLALTTQGYICSPKGLVKRGILQPAKASDVRNMVTNPYAISVTFVEKGVV